MPEEIIFSKTTLTQETVIIKTSKDVYKLAFRWKKICFENMYTWRTMDQDIINEARKLINGSP